MSETSRNSEGSGLGLAISQKIVHMKRAENIEQIDEKFAPFANKLRQLYKGFQEKAMKEFISQYRREKP
ncbi:hypothetical protein [Kamptonema sp. UHCC 0994]|uniref:hypothetical protein n=1 Tax=Kamptonema sp. UHCC 0994 TaxID=3031329 RepID=UPI0023B8F871|nr:hypothetical protein [Kamptonema sp. UHCC 0994]MDF0551606.1 hypothetical protein [Kamptonema sp. UHCC 0994]